MENHSISAQTFPFFNLPDVVLRELFKRYISVKDKVTTLVHVPEFSPFLERQGPWFSDTHYQYFQLCRNLLLLPGWYCLKLNDRPINTRWYHVTYDTSHFTVVLSSFSVPLSCSRSFQKRRNPLESCVVKNSVAQCRTFLAEFQKTAITNLEPTNVYCYKYWCHRHGFTKGYMIVDQIRKEIRWIDGKRYAYNPGQYVVYLSFSDNQYEVHGPGLNHFWKKYNRWLRLVMSEEEKAEEAVNDENRHIWVKSLNYEWERLEPVVFEIPSIASDEYQVDEKIVRPNNKWTFQINPSNEMRESNKEVMVKCERFWWNDDDCVVLTNFLKVNENYYNWEKGR